jgi:hypothetical protein
VLGGGLGGQVPAPGDRVHSERLPDPRHSRADPAQTENAESLAVRPLVERFLPATCAHRPGLGDQIAGGAEDQRPGVLDGGMGFVACPARRDAEPVRGREVDGGVRRAGADQELKAGQLLQDLGRDRRYGDGEGTILSPFGN